jgi:hypothetical protein
MRGILLLFLVSTCLAKDVRNDFDPATDFSRFRTFSFVKGIDVGHSGVLDDPLTRERVANFISGALEARGLREVPSDEKYDLAVRYWLAKLDKRELHPDLTALLIDLIDVKTKERSESTSPRSIRT